MDLLKLHCYMSSNSKLSAAIIQLAHVIFARNTLGGNSESTTAIPITLDWFLNSLADQEPMKYFRARRANFYK